MVSPVTVIGLADPVPVKPPGLEVTVYPVIAEPPLLTCAVNIYTTGSPNVNFTTDCSK